MIDLQNIDNKEPLIKDFFTWLFDDDSIIDKGVFLQSEVDLSLAPYYMDANIYYPKQLADFFQTTAMKRLSRISQLSLLMNVSPNVYHNRLEHSKGTYNRKLEEMLYNFQNSDWKEYIEKNNLKLYLLGDLIKIAGHDIGHFPLSHTFEEEIYGKHGAHEIIGKKIMLEDEEIKNILTSISPKLPDIIKDLYEKDIFNFNNHDDGNYDVDRIDFLSRDSLYLGNPQEMATQRYNTVCISKDSNGNPIVADDLSIIESNNSPFFIDVYDYEALKPIENLLELHFSSYQNDYMSKSSKLYESTIGMFFKAFLSTESESGQALKNFIAHLQNLDINDIDLSEFLKWDDITFYSQIIEIAENHEDSNIRSLATMTIPKLKPFLNMLYSHLDLRNNKTLSVDDLAFLRKIKHIIKSDDELSRNLRDPNFVLKNALEKENASPSSFNEAFNDFSYVLRAYSKNAPIYVRAKNGKIYELSKHPERKCNWDERKVLLNYKFAYIPFLKFKGFSEKDIDNLRNSCDEITINDNREKRVNMQPLRVGHNIEDAFLEL